jgi:immune inhibitor A
MKVLRTLLLAVLAVGVLGLGYSGTPATGAGGTAVASGWALFKYPQGQPVCGGVALRGNYFGRLDCGYGSAAITGTTATSKVFFDFVAEDGTVVRSQAATRTAAGAWQFTVAPASAWPAGQLTIKARVDGVAAVEGELPFFVNQLGAGLTAAARSDGYQPGAAIPVSGSLYELRTVAADEIRTPVAGTFSIRVVTPSGEIRGPYGPFTANRGAAGQISETLPWSATSGLTATAATNYETTVGLEVVNASYADPVTGAWQATGVSAGYVTLTVPPPSLVLENSFVSAVGWVKPGDAYPFRVFVKNYGHAAEAGAVVKLPAVDGTTFTKVQPTPGSGTAAVAADGSITWTVGTVPARTDAGPGTTALVVEAKADRLTQDLQIVWKDLSSTASLTYTGGPTVTDKAQGPKVIPPDESFDTARYGNRPFPVVPVDYRDRKHDATHSADRLLAVINSKDVPGSTFNLFQEMSYGQLFPNGYVPSTAVAQKGWDATWKSGRTGFTFTTPMPNGACAGTTTGPAYNTPLTPDRIKDGWYQLPGDTNYYGGDKTNVVGTDVAVLTGVGALVDIDNGCGPIAKSVYDAAHISDPEIDYSDFDTDKDGVVDFFMMVFAGNGGNGASQLTVPPYDNIWPHSSSLEFYYEDKATGLSGYISDDQLRDNEGRDLFYVDGGRQSMTTSPTPFPVYVRVGPYNVNPESAIERASVISHEYGHSLGLPDFYSTGGRTTYGDWNLMATDKSQNMDVFSKQELGWIVPRPLGPGVTSVTGWKDSKTDTNRIDWQTPNGASYALTGPDVHNGEAYTAKLPGRILIDPAKIAAGASPDHVWWSRSGNDFGCTPLGAHNLDVFVPELATVPAGTPITLTFTSMWDIEWDYDYGFVLATTDGGESYASFPSAKGYTTPVGQNPNANGCQAKYGNGITGSSGSYKAGTQELDRPVALDVYPEAEFIADQYDLSSLAGKAATLRFSYATDPGLARPGWFIDDLKITAGDRVIYDSNMETAGDPRLYNGGCQESTTVAKRCTAGWQWVDGSSPSAADHGYYLELRDRSSFDLDGKGQNDRDPIGFIPGLLLTYTDEAHGYGNAGVDGAPAQSPLDANPQPGVITPNLNDAAFSFTGVRSFTDAGAGRVDNYKDPRRADGLWRFDYGCLAFDVLAMAGDDIGPATAPGNLTADVTFTTGPGCKAFEYGHGGPVVPENAPPTAVAQAKPTTAEPRQRVRFDASGSTDDATPPAELGYRWDLDGNGTWDATGPTARTSYRRAGTYVAKLEVTDGGGLTGTATVTITVRD